ncbi:MAG: hypothetical protein M0029_03825 [Actinomycetota bacterium]|nr:hypothetical protein [Actinomycetota bacterium]
MLSALRLTGPLHRSASIIGADGAGPKTHTGRSSWSICVISPPA